MLAIDDTFDTFAESTIITPGRAFGKLGLVSPRDPSPRDFSPEKLRSAAVWPSIGFSRTFAAAAPPPSTHASTLVCPLDSKCKFSFSSRADIATHLTEIHGLETMDLGEKSSFRTEIIIEILQRKTKRVGVVLKVVQENFFFLHFDLYFCLQSRGQCFLWLLESLRRADGEISVGPVVFHLCEDRSSSGSSSTDVSETPKPEFAVKLTAKAKGRRSSAISKTRNITTAQCTQVSPPPPNSKLIPSRLHAGFGSRKRDSK